jgi:hypothetical protein
LKRTLVKCGVEGAILLPSHMARRWTGRRLGLPLPALFRRCCGSSSTLRNMRLTLCCLLLLRWLHLLPRLAPWRLLPLTLLLLNLLRLLPPRSLLLRWRRIKIFLVVFPFWIVVVWLSSFTWWFGGEPCKYFYVYEALLFKTLWCVSELFLLLYFQTVYAGGSSNRGCESLPTDVFDSGAPSPPCSPCWCTEYLLRISDLEGHFSLMKRQAKSTLDQAGKSYDLMK